MPSYLLNTWYVAAWSSELKAGTVLGRTLLEQPVACSVVQTDLRRPCWTVARTGSRRSATDGSRTDG